MSPFANIFVNVFFLIRGQTQNMALWILNQNESKQHKGYDSANETVSLSKLIVEFD